MIRGAWRRAAAALLAAGTIAAVLVACTPKVNTDAAPSRAPVTKGAPVGFEEYYSQKVAWEKCRGLDEGDYFCASITAPRDWTDPKGEDIELSVIVRIASSGDAKGSLFVNPGGPGASGVDLVQQSAGFAVGTDLLDSYDVVGFDPRGVGRSTAVRCFDAAAMDDYLFDTPAAPRGSAERAKEQRSSAEAFARACETNSGGLLPFVTTQNAARDLDLLRGVLGDEKLSYLGYSYGSFLGATYAELFPQNVGRVVLDGGLDPSIPSAVVGARQAAGFQSALDAFLTSCVGGPDCPFDGPLATAQQQLSDALAAVDASPLKATDGRMLGADALSLGIISALYSESNWSRLSSALTSVLEGDADDMFELVDQYYNRYDGMYLDNSTEAFSAYNCMDYPADPADVVEAANKDVAEKAPTFAPYWSSDVNLCDAWPYPPTGTRNEIHADGAAPILVIGTTNDPATPYEWSAALAEQLNSGILLTRVGEGHTGFNKGNACIDDTVVAYFDDGTVPEGDVRCEAG
ncbi:Carboxylesterase B [Microbacterium oleivorans]|uniref:alpha/beta hydrolase n=1 Tax=Microbacterium oleivorans TaxID=273677 RepID=UPI0009765C85|nr:alpha/beta hydrolase [Microbacterium oleivorans]AZS43238.1 Carboxylesterase B [Microbacterium oleivorans]